MSWFYLIIAAIFEMGWPIGLKFASLSELSNLRILWIIFSIVTMALSGLFLYLAQKEVPIGTAYAIWTGIGMIGTFLVGITIFNDSVSLIRFVGVFLILAGVIILKLCH